MFQAERMKRLSRRLSALRAEHWLILILGFALSLRVVFFLGLCVADDFTYCRFVSKILHGEPYFSAESEFRSLRWPTILPVLLSFWVFGVSDVAAVWGSLAYSLGGIVVLFLIGRQLFGDRVGLYAALLLAAFPGDALFATQLMPDIAISFFMGLSVLFFLKGEAASDPREATRLYGLCGLAMLGAFLCRVTAVYHFLFFACFVFSRRRLKRRAWLVFGAFGAALGLLYLFYYFKTGDLFYELALLKKIRATEESLGRITQLRLTRNLEYMIPILNSQVGRLDLYAVEARIWLASTYLFGFFYYFIIPCFFYWAFRARRDARLAVPVLWLLVTYLYSEFGTISLSKYQHMVKLPRYLLIQTMPGLLLVALWVDSLIRGSREARRAPGRVVTGVGLLLFLIVTSVGIVQKEAAGSRAHIAPYRAVHALLKDRPRKDLFVTDGWWPLRMSHYFGRENGYIDPPDGAGNRLRLLKNTRDVAGVRDAYAVVDRNPFLGVGDFKYSYRDYPVYVERIPAHWQRLGSFYNVEVYYVPQDIPPAVAEAYRRDFSTWEGAKSAFERAVREKSFEMFKSCLSEKFRAGYDDAQLRGLFEILLRTPSVVSQLEQKHFFEENGRWRISLTVEKAGGQGSSVLVR